MALSQLVREARLRAGLSQQGLAARAGVAKSTIGRIESGTRIPSTALVERIARAAGFEIHPSLVAPDPGTDSMFERALQRTPAQRLADATRIARLVQQGRRSLGTPRV